MTFLDAPGNPDIQPTGGPGGIPRIVVRPKGGAGPDAAGGSTPGTGGDPWGDFKPVPSSTAAPPAAQGEAWGDFKPVGDDGQSTAEKPRQVGSGEALGKGILEGASFGFAPAVTGLAEVAGPEWIQRETYGEMGNPVAPIVGAAKLLHNYFSSHPDPNVTAAYTRGREAALKDQDLAKEQHPQIYLAGQLAGTLAMPLPGAGAMRAGTLGQRAWQGARVGAEGGGLYGAGESTSQGNDVGQIATDTAKGAGFGAMVGAGVGAAVGPRPRMMPGPGSQAARTAEIIGAPLPKGFASDNAHIQGAASSALSAPIVGPRMGRMLDTTRERAGQVVRGSGVQDAIDANRATIDHLYDRVRGMINPDRMAPMPRLGHTINTIVARRLSAWGMTPTTATPQALSAARQGLEQFDSLAWPGATFNGAHRARVDARNAGDVVNPHPGYNAADFNMIVRAMTGDLREMVARLAASNGTRANAIPRARRALEAFDRAERSFGPISGANQRLRKLVDKRGADATLEDLGFNPTTGEFSLDKFVSEMGKINPEQAPFIPTPSHRAAIEAIFQLGQHLKTATRGRNTSHTSNAMVLFDIAKTAGEIGVGVAVGAMTAGSVAGAAAGAAPGILFLRWLSQPATAMSMSRWSRAYQGLLGSRTPARVAAFNMATRNLANNIGVPVERIIDTIRRKLPVAADPDQDNERK